MNEIVTKSKNVFANRNFRLVFFGALVSELGAGLYSFAVSFYILEISNNNAFLQGMYLTLCGVVLLLFTPIGGVLGDRFNKAGIMFICDYLRGLLVIAATVLMILFKSADAHIVILFAVGGLGNAIGGIFSPAAHALFPHIVDEEKLQQANSYVNIKSSLLGIFGVVLAGIMYGLMPVTTLFLIVGVCYVLSGVSEMFIRYEHRVSTEKLTIKLALGDMKEGFVYLKQQKAIVALMIAILFVNFFIAPFYSNFLPYFIKTDVAAAESYIFDGFLTPELWSSVLSVVMGISSLIASAILSAKKQDDRIGGKVAKLLCANVGLMVLLTGSYRLFETGVISISAFLIALCTGGLIWGFLLPNINIPITTTFMRVVDRDKLSKVTSITAVFSQGLIPIATALAGVILQYFGSTVLLSFCTAGFAVTALFLLINKETKKI
ncbi:MAG: MFS transporter [Lachnospiraceae bacterium]|nr:MFS transporter [Lachnospiraceae bacterium]